MSPLLRYLQPRLSLPTPAQTEIGDCATTSVNTEVIKELDKGKENGRKKEGPDKDRETDSINKICIM